MPSTMDFGAPTDDELVAMDRLLGEAFGLEPARWLPWRMRIGQDALRVLRDGGDVVACLGCYRFAQSWGGRFVPSVGVAGVGTSPLRRGEGVGRALLSSLVREEAERRTPYLALFPTSRPFYRKAGFEEAGDFVFYSAPIADFATGVRLPLESFEPVNFPFVRPLYHRRAKQIDGHLDRTLALWQRLAIHPEHEVRGYAVRRGGKGEPVTGYVMYVQRPITPFGFDVEIRDWAAADRESLAALMDHLHGLRSLAREVHWRGPARDALVSALPTTHVQVTKQERWLLRLVDFEQAIAARGFRCSDRVIEVALHDPEVPSQHGAYRVEIEGGVGRATRIASAALTLDVRGMSGVYTGYLDEHALELGGYVDGDRAALARWVGAFVGPRSWLPDFF